MREWLQMRPKFLHELIKGEEPPTGLRCTECSAPTGAWRCSNCLGRPVYCTGCCRQAHEKNPLHRVEQWTGEFFQPAWLRSTGVYIALGHRGAPCPFSDVHGPPANCSTAEEQVSEGWKQTADDDEVDDESSEIPPNFCEKTPKRDAQGNPVIVVVDTTGIHHIGVKWCVCLLGKEKWAQLLEIGLYPGSIARPKTAFTFQVLDDFLIENAECKTSALSYYSKLKRITSNAFPQLAAVSTVRYAMVHIC